MSLFFVLKMDFIEDEGKISKKIFCFLYSLFSETDIGFFI